MSWRLSHISSWRAASFTEGRVMDLASPLLVPFRVFQSFLLNHGCSEYPGTCQSAPMQIYPEPKCLEVASFPLWWIGLAELQGCSEDHFLLFPTALPTVCFPTFWILYTNRWKMVSHCSLSLHCFYKWSWTTFHMLRSTLYFLFCSSCPLSTFNWSGKGKFWAHRKWGCRQTVVLYSQLIWWRANTPQLPYSLRCPLVLTMNLAWDVYLISYYS